MSEYTVAVVGATGVVGKEMIEILESRKFPVKKLVPLASERSFGQTVFFNKKHIQVEILDENSFQGVDIALFSAGGSISEKYCPHAVKSNAVCIDNTSHYRMDTNVPLVVPEVNEADIFKHKGIIANPNCSTAQLVVILKPIYDKVGIERLIISTYQSVSGAGKEAIVELENLTRRSLAGQNAEPKVFTYPIAFNVIPHIDKFEENGYTKEEMKMILETQKIMGDDNIKVTTTTVRVPVFIGHSEAINIQTKTKILPKEVRDLLKAAPGVSVLDDPQKNQYPTPRDIAGKDDVYVGRIREDISQDNGIELWCVGDNLRKGAALNAVQIAESLIQGKK